MNEEIKDKKTTFDTASLHMAIQSSLFSDELQSNFSELLATDVTNAKFCFQLAEDLYLVISQNQSRVRGEYFSAYRQGSVRHQIIEEKLNNSIENLSKGNVDDGKKLLAKTISLLSSYNRSTLLFTSKIPELDVLNKIYNNLNNGVDKNTQMKM